MAVEAVFVVMEVAEFPHNYFLENAILFFSALWVLLLQQWRQLSDE